jgi:hypothetical protein
MNKETGKLYITEQIKVKIINERYKQYKQKKEFSGSYQRIKLLKEMLESERNYVKFINQLIEEYYRPLKKGTEENKNNGLEEKEVKTIFCNIEEIYELNVKFLKELEKEYEGFPNSQISKVFKKYSEKIHENYSLYINNFPKSMDLLKNLVKKNKNLSIFLDFKQKVSKLNQINFYLIMPVQSNYFF